MILIEGTILPGHYHQHNVVASMLGVERQCVSAEQHLCAGAASLMPTSINLQSATAEPSQSAQGILRAKVARGLLEGDGARPGGVGRAADSFSWPDPMPVREASRPRFEPRGLLRPAPAEVRCAMSAMRSKKKKVY